MDNLTKLWAIFGYTRAFLIFKIIAGLGNIIIRIIEQNK